MSKFKTTITPIVGGSSTDTEDVARLALFSEEHGNDVAFKGAAEPSQVLERLRGLGCRTVLGNADAFVPEVPETSLTRADHRAIARGARVDARRTRASGVTADAVVRGGRRGRPRWEANRLLPDATLLPDVIGTPLDHYLAPLPADLLAGGHTPRLGARAMGDAFFINPRSVGVPAGRGLPGRVPLRGEWALVVDELGPSVESHQVDYSFADHERAASTSGRPYWESIVSSSA